MANMPNYARVGKSQLMHWIERFHEKVASRLNNENHGTLRKTAWQIEEYLETHGGYYDAEFIRALQHSIEKVVQHKCNSNWSVKKASYDLRGRTTGTNQYSFRKGDRLPGERRHRQPPRLSKEINDQIIPKPE